METKILNPETKRWIKVGGKAYNDLLARKKLPKNPKTKQTPVYVPPTDYKVPSSFKKYPVDHSDVPWGTVKPDKINDRRNILNNCGKSCFLIPEKLAFPICNKTLPCTYNCRGIKAASSRAGEWKYGRVLERSKNLSKRFDCYVKKK